MEELGASLYLDDADCTPEAFMEKLEEVINNTQKMIELQNNAKKTGQIRRNKKHSRADKSCRKITKKNRCLWRKFASSVCLRYNIITVIEYQGLD